MVAGDERGGVVPVVYVAVFVGVFEEVGARGVEVGAQAVEVERRCEADGTGGDSEVAGEVGVAEEDEFAVAGLRDGTRDTIQLKDFQLQ